MLDLDPELTNIVNKDKLFVTFRKAKTLGDLLVHSRYPRQADSPHHNGSIKCNKCVLCKNFLVETDTVQSQTTNKILHINNTVKCTDTHVIYVITDLICGKQSVGSTDGTMRVRFSNHKSHIKKNVKSCRVAVHYNEEPKHKFDRDKLDATLALELRVTLLDKVTPEPWDSPSSIFQKLMKKESYWQNQLQSFTWVGGLNTRNERTITNTHRQYPM